MATAKIYCVVDGCNEFREYPANEVTDASQFICPYHAPRKRNGDPKDANAQLKVAADGPVIPRSQIASAISQETANLIDLSLASVPAEQKSDPILVEAETSHGTKLVREDGDPDNYDSDANRIKKQKSVDPLLTPIAPDKPKKQPAYIKSVPHATVPSGDPHAKYGRDQSDRPIGMYTAKEITVPTVNIPCECGRRDCGRCNPRVPLKKETLADKIARFVRFKEFGMKGLPKESNTTAWGFERRNINAPRIFTEHERDNIPSRPSRQEIVAMLNMVVCVQPFVIEDRTKPKQKRILSPGVIQGEISRLTKRIPEITSAIEDLISDADEFKQLLKTYSAKAQKRMVKRGELGEHEVFSKVDRQRRKREVERDIKQREGKMRELQAEKRLAETKLENLCERIRNWGTGPDDAVWEYPKTVRKHEILFRDILHVPDEDNFLGVMPRGYSYSDDSESGAVGAYAQLVFEYGDGRDANSVFKYWRRFEDAVIRQACELNPETLTDDEELETDHNEETALTAKHGGTNIGGQIYGAGTDWKGRKRSLSGFSNGIGKRRGDATGEEPGEHEGAGDDSESYQPD